MIWTISGLRSLGMSIYIFRAVVLIMQLGFAFLEAGCVRYKNIQSIMIKVYANTAVAIVMMWIVIFIDILEEWLWSYDGRHQF